MLVGSSLGSGCRGRAAAGGRSAQWRRCRRSTPTVTSCRCRPGTAFRAPSTGSCASASRAWPTSRRTRRAPASDADLALRPRPGYVAAVQRGTLGAAEQRAIGFPWSEAMVERSRRSVGATIAAARAALAEGVAANLAGGTHHASAPTRQRLLRLQRRRRRRARSCRPRHRAALLRVVVVDLDVHQGDGTAAIFAGDPSVFTISLHGAKNFPFRKARERPRRRPARRLRRRRLPRRARPAPSPCSATSTPSGRSAWPSTSPAPIRTRATGSAGSSSAPPACSSATAACSRALASARHPGRAGDGRRLRPRPRRHGRDPGGDDRGRDRAWRAGAIARPAARVAQRACTTIAP